MANLDPVPPENSTGPEPEPPARPAPKHSAVPDQEHSARSDQEHPAGPGPSAAASAGTGERGSDLPAPEVAVRLRLVLGRLARLLRQQTPGGLTSSQTSALASVEELEPVRLSELATVEGVSMPTLSRLVAGLESLDLLVRKPDPADGRAAQLHITDAGRAELDRLRTERSAFLIERLSTLGPGQRTALSAALDALEALARTAPDTPGTGKCATDTLGYPQTGAP